MNQTRAARSWLAALLATALVAPLAAHQLPLEVVAYVKAEGAMLRVLVRVPLAVLVDARLPVRGDGYLDLQALDGPMAGVTSYVARSLDVGMVSAAGMMNAVNDDIQPLPAPRASWRLTRRPDASFDTWEAAAARLLEPRLPADTAVDPDKALVDIELDYPLAAAAAATARFSIRVNDFRAAGGRPVQMRVQSLVAGAARGALVTTGATRRVVLNPEWRGVLRAFGRMSLNELTRAVELLLFVLCLAIPRRSMQSALSVLSIFAAGFVAALVVSAWTTGAVDPQRVRAFHTLAAAVLVVTALQNVTAPRLIWLWVSAAAFGLVDGPLFGFAYRGVGPLAGSHALLSLAAFAGPILLASFWLLLVTKPAVGFVYRVVAPGPEGRSVAPGPTGPSVMPGPVRPGLRERWATVLLSVIPIHAGLHGLGLW